MSAFSPSKDPWSFFSAPTALQLELGRQTAALVAEYTRRVDAFLRAEATARGQSIEQLAALYRLASESRFQPPGTLTTHWWLEPIPASPQPPA